MISSYGFQKVIYGVKNYLVLQVSCQEPIMSSKYPHQGQGFLDTLIFIQECWNFAHRSGIMYQEQLCCQGWSISSLSLVRNHQCPPSHWWLHGGSWHTSDHVRMLKFGTQVKNSMSRPIMRWRMTYILHDSIQEPSMSLKSLMVSKWFLTHS